MSLAVLMWSAAAALPVTLLFEQPMLTLEKFLLPNRRRDRNDLNKVEPSAVEDTYTLPKVSLNQNAAD